MPRLPAVIATRMPGLIVEAISERANCAAMTGAGSSISVGSRCCRTLAQRGNSPRSNTFKPLRSIMPLLVSTVWAHYGRNERDAFDTDGEKGLSRLRETERAQHRRRCWARLTDGG